VTGRREATGDSCHCPPGASTAPTSRRTWSRTSGTCRCSSSPRLTSTGSTTSSALGRAQRRRARREDARERPRPRAQGVGRRGQARPDCGQRRRSARAPDGRAHRHALVIRRRAAPFRPARRGRPALRRVAPVRHDRHAPRGGGRIRMGGTWTSTLGRSRCAGSWASWTTSRRSRCDRSRGPVGARWRWTPPPSRQLRDHRRRQLEQRLVAGQAWQPTATDHLGPSGPGWSSRGRTEVSSTPTGSRTGSRPTAGMRACR
jgi:hypothetical protein